MTDDISFSFGQKLRDLRERSGLSLRELAKQAKVSAPFLSDVELGRRFPNDETLMLIAKSLRISAETLKKHDHRTAIADLKRMADSTPVLGAAIRAMADQVKSGAITPAELAAKLRELCATKAK
jgi:transcriptional regulator with XRE-family HTH domain